VQISYSGVSAFNTSPYTVLEISPYVTYRATTEEPLYMTLQFVSNVGGQGTPDGHFNILGESRAQPPPPTGSLFIPAGDYLLEGADPNPEVQATIVRE
jgi:hypothetical protein